MVSAQEREVLIAEAHALEALSEDHEGEPDESFTKRLAAFNLALRAECDIRTFQFLYQSEEPEDLVDRLLELRDLPTYTPPRTREELELYLSRAKETRTFGASEQAEKALAHMSQLPLGLAQEMSGRSSAHVEFALSYEPPKSREQLYAMLRAWLAAVESAHDSPLAVAGERILRERAEALELQELEPIVKLLASGISVQVHAGYRRLRRLLGAP